ncbi:MAG: FMN-binding protein [Actinobacteria bacterium]|nr:FMN-binding protein [Actinomycetota bacterium]
MMKTMLDLGIRLLVVCLVAAVGLGFTYSIVEKRIAEQEMKKRAEAAEAVLSPIGAEPRENLELAASLQEDHPDLIGVFEGIDAGGNIIGYAFVLKSKGYNFITMAVGVDANGQVTGIEIVTNEETPGLGAVAAENEEFLGQFTGKGPDTLTLGEDIDGVSSATFTSRGITNGVNLSLEIWDTLEKGS